jgi:hypothetical protein
LKRKDNDEKRGKSMQLAPDQLKVAYAAKFQRRIEGAEPVSPANKHTGNDWLNCFHRIIVPNGNVFHPVSGFIFKFPEYWVISRRKGFLADLRRKKRRLRR